MGTKQQIDHAELVKTELQSTQTEMLYHAPDGTVFVVMLNTIQCWIYFYTHQPLKKLEIFATVILKSVTVVIFVRFVIFAFQKMQMKTTGII